MTEKELKNKCTERAKIFQHAMENCKSSSPIDCIEWFADRIAELEAQIEKMKCGGNCKHEYWINTGGCYDQKCRFTGLDCTKCKDKWEIKENE